MDLRQLEYFVAVAEELHFTRAAAAVHVAQPALSQQIQKLEAELGQPLLVRSSRHVALTEAGELLLPRARALLADADAARAELDSLRGLVRGRIRIGAMQSLGPLDLPAVLAEFHHLHPGIEVTLWERTSSTMRDLLLGDEIDAAFIDVVEAGHEALDHLEAFREDVVLIAAPGSAWARRKAVSVAQLAGEDFIMFAEGTGLRGLTERLAADAGFEPHVAFESNELERVRALASHALGVALVPRSTAEGPGPPVACLPLRPRVRRRVGLAWRRARRQSPAAASFLAFVRERLV
jgi:DNA-binding transcriptional LysR family regulator